MNTVKTEFDIAIVGMAGRFPGARDLDEFWQNLAGGIESIARLSDSEILESGVPTAWLNNPNYVKAAPVLDEPGHFDAAFFGFSPGEAKTLDPQHRILLELAYEALENASCDPERYLGRIGVFTGSAMNTYFMNAGLSARFAEDYIPTLIGNDKDFLSTRISYKLNLKGPSVTVQTACSTSMVAVHLARQSLLSEETDMALAGAVSVRVPHHAGYFFDGGGVVSPDGHVRAFDTRANGTVFGSGGGILVLKRLADALADGDTIHAVIKGSAVNNDGSEKAGYTAPSVNSQADAVAEALANAGVEADNISYIEAHGSGTPVGDPIEVRALTKAFRTSTQRSGFCALGSVKTNVGHLDAAAAVTGIIKTVLALKHRQIPPSLHFMEANAEIDFANTPFYVNTQLREWTSNGPRRAGVMSTGMGGTNAHVVLEEAPEPLTPALSPSDGEKEIKVDSPHLLVLSAKTETALDQATNRLREFLIRNESTDLSDVAYTLQMGRKRFPHRRCLTCADRQDAIAALGEENSKRVLSSEANATESERRQVIFLLPGIGDHYVGMAHGLYEAWPVFREEVDWCAQILESYLGADIRRIIYPPDQNWKTQRKPKGIDLKQMLGRKADATENPDSKKLNQTLFAQPALFTIEYAMARLWQSLGVTPDAIIGHSMGEYVAACLAGVLSLEDALRLIATRAQLVNELPQGTMLAVTLPENELLPLLPEGLSISLINAPRLCVVAGAPDAVAGFEKKLNDKGIICRHVQNAHAFHSRMLDPIVKPFEAEVRKVQLNEPTIPYISNVTGKWITRAQTTDPAYWAAHANHTARFSDALKALWQHKDAILLEAGPGRTLGVLAMQHLDRNGGNPVTASSIRHDYENRSDSEFLWQAIGRLWLAGVAIKWENAHQSRRRRVPLPTYPFERQHYWLETKVATKAAEDEARGQGRTVHKNPDSSQWLYVPSWKRLLPRAIGMDAAALHAEQTRTWLVFADDSGFAPALIERLESAGHDVITVRAGDGFQQPTTRTFTVEPGNVNDYGSLVSALQANGSLPDRIIHAWSVAPSNRETVKTASASTIQRFNTAQSVGFYSLLFLARTLAAQNIGQEIKLFALSNNVHEVCGSETLCPEKATLLGPCMVIHQEYPNLRVKSIDLDASEFSRSPESAANLVIGEFVDPDASLFVAYRNGQRWVQTYEPVRVTSDVCRETGTGAATSHATRHLSPFREGGVYLISGGLGSIGIAISEYLAGNYRAKLVLVGRSNLPGRESWSEWIASHETDDPISRKIAAIERIENRGGDVLHVNASVADAAAMRRVIEEAYRHFGALHGVIHGAGIVGDDGYLEIKDTDPNRCEKHFQAKVHGLRVLEEVLEGKELDFCLLMSSLACVLGGIGQAAYASANIYMDAFARRHNRTSPLPWLSVNWDVWRLDHAAANSGLGGTLKELGMNTAEAMDMLETVLAMKSAGQLVVSTGDLDARIDQWINLDLLRSPNVAVTAPVRSPKSNHASTQARRDAPRDEAEHLIAQIWQDALGIDEVGIHDNFAELGGHSLLAIRIVTELRRAFQIDLPVRAMFDAPTVTALSRHIQEQLITEIESLSDEDARLLVASG
jgi:acyl transferase domain-containing protein/acyl carrier protein